jgi:hypothetical protein
MALTTKTPKLSLRRNPTVLTTNRSSGNSPNRSVVGPSMTLSLKRKVVSGTSSYSLLGLSFVRLPSQYAHSTYLDYLILAVRSPDDAKIKNKMVYASSKDALRRSLVGISTEIQGTDTSEVAYDTGTSNSQ